MRFEPASQPTPTGGADVSVRQTTRFTLEQPPFAGQSFAVAFRVCANPCCPCEVVTVECRPETAPESVVPFCVEVFDRRLAGRVQTSPEGIALGKAFVAETQDSEWEWLEGLFLGAKLEAIEGVDDVDQLEVDLPPRSGGGGRNDGRVHGDLSLGGPVCVHAGRRDVGCGRTVLHGTGVHLHGNRHGILPGAGPAAPHAGFGANFSVSFP